MSLVCGCRDVWSVFSGGAFSIRSLTLAFTVAGFGLLLVISGIARSAHVKSHFGFLDTHLHLTWFHNLNGFMCFQGDVLSVVAATVHWLTAILCVWAHCFTGALSEERPLLG
jgi:hypothetical protein